MILHQAYLSKQGLFAQILTFFIIVTALCGVNVHAGQGNPFAYIKSIQRFIDQDKGNSTPKEAVLFVGSSSINYWPTAEAFPDKPVINRGFGGSETADVLYFYDHVIGKYKPKTVVVYVGSNDIARDEPVAGVFRDLQTLFTRMRADFPKAKLIYLSSNPSLMRLNVWDKMQAVNSRMENFVKADSRMIYLDVASHLLSKDGLPDKAYFRLDGLHLNEAGYEVMNKIVRPYL